MGSRIECFLVEPTGRSRHGIVVMETRDCTAGGGICSARVQMTVHDSAARLPRLDEDSLPWPTSCGRCGTPFTEKASRGSSGSPFYRRADGTGGEFPISEAAPGAMFYDEDWIIEKGPEGKGLVVVLPGGDLWYVDGFATNGPGWTRSGSPPKVTAHPSILTPRYHGWLRDGVLIEC